MLLPLTNKHLDVTLINLAESKFEVNESIKDGIKTIIINKDLLWIFLERVTMFGNAYWLKWILELEYVDLSSNKQQLDKLMKNLILSDNFEAFTIFVSKFQFKNFTEEMMKLALSHEKLKFIEAMKIQNVKIYKDTISDFYAFVKSEEFEYH